MVKETQQSRLRRLLSNETGRELLELLTEEVDGSCYSKGDPYHTAFLEGRRDLVNQLKEALRNARPRNVITRRTRAGSTGNPGSDPSGRGPTCDPSDDAR